MYTLIFWHWIHNRYTQKMRFACFRPTFSAIWTNFGPNWTKKWSETDKSHFPVTDLKILPLTVYLHKEKFDVLSIN